MKKIIIALFSVLFLSSTGLAESYYFKSCKLSNAVTASYTINLDQNIIEVDLESVDGAVQNFKDKIMIIEKDKIVSEKIKSSVGEDIYYQYFLNAKKGTVIKLEYKKEKAMDTEVYRLHSSRKSTCKDIKTDWDKIKIDEAKISEEQKQILKAQEKIKEEQDSLIECQGDNYLQWTKCKGSYKSDTGHKYTGLFIEGKIVKGISIYPGGAQYVGEFLNFKPHGYGRFAWKNGDLYYGEWKDGKSNGNGTKVWKNGRKYSGTFKNDKLHGAGVMYYPDGGKYEGKFLNNKRHGEGTFTYADGTAFIGKYIAGKQEGLGECIGKDGSSIPCKSRTDTLAKDFSGKDTHNISLVAKKWVRLSQYETNSKKGKKIMDQLKIDFETKAQETCSSKGKYNVLDKKIEIVEVDETPAYGLETKVLIGINGAVECV